MTERLSLCLFCLLVVEPLAGCGSRRQQQADPPPLRPGSVFENLPGDNSPPHKSNYTKEMLEAAERARRPRGPLDREVSFSFLGSKLSETVGTLSRLTGISMTILSGSSAPESLHARRVSLTMHNVRLADALEWIMRQVDAQYAWDGAGVCIASSREKLFSDELIEHVYPLRRMKLYDKPVIGFHDVDSEKNSILKCVKDLLAEYRKYRPKSKFVLTPQRGEFVAICSALAHQRIEEALHEMARGRETLPPLRPEANSKDIEKKLEKIVFCAYQDRPVIEILGKLSTDSGVNIGIDTRELAQGENTRITLNLAKASLRFALQQIVKLCKLEAYKIEPGRGVWLRGSRPHPADRRSLWEWGVIRSYYVEPTAKKIGLAQLIGLVKQNITPGQWRNGLPVMTHAPTGRLIVFHTRDAHADLYSYLHKLEKLVVYGELTGRE